MSTGPKTCSGIFQFEGQVCACFHMLLAAYHCKLSLTPGILYILCSQFQIVDIILRPESPLGILMWSSCEF